MASSITRIDIFRNSVYNSGDEGHDWLGRMYNLRQLLYGQTNFEYAGIPPQIARLSNLEEYDCSYTLYFGKLDGRVFERLHNLGRLLFNKSPITLSKSWRSHAYLSLCDYMGPCSNVQRVFGVERQRL